MADLPGGGSDGVAASLLTTGSLPEWAAGADSVALGAASGVCPESGTRSCDAVTGLAAGWSGCLVGGTKLRGCDGIRSVFAADRLSFAVEPGTTGLSGGAVPPASFGCSGLLSVFSSLILYPDARYAFVFPQTMAETVHSLNNLPLQYKKPASNPAQLRRLTPYIKRNLYRNEAVSAPIT